MTLLSEQRAHWAGRSRLRGQVWDKPEAIGQLISAAPTAWLPEQVAREGHGVG